MCNGLNYKLRASYANQLKFVNTWNRCELRTNAKR